MPVTITIRDVPEEVRDELVARASRSGRSFQEYLVGWLTELASQPSVEDAIADARRHTRSSGPRTDAARILADLTPSAREACGTKIVPGCCYLGAVIDSYPITRSRVNLMRCRCRNILVDKRDLALRLSGWFDRLEHMFDTIADVDTDLEMRVDFCRPQHVGPAQREAITRTMLETLPPGDGLGGVLAAVDPADLDMHDLVSFLGACERQTAWTQAAQLRAVRELAGRRLVPGPNGEPADTPLPAGVVNEYAADEVAAVLAQSRFSGEKRVWLATALTRLPATEAAFAAGVLNLSKTTAIAEGLAVLDDDAIATAEARVLVRAPKQTLGQLRASISRAVLAADPSTAKERAEKAKAERRVELTPRADGMCEFWALLSAPDAMALYTAITALADQARAAEHAEANEIKKAHAAAASGCAPATGSDAAFAAYGFTPEGVAGVGVPHHGPAARRRAGRHGLCHPGAARPAAQPPAPPAHPGHRGRDHPARARRAAR